MKVRKMLLMLLLSVVMIFSINTQADELTYEQLKEQCDPWMIQGSEIYPTPTKDFSDSVNEVTKIGGAYAMMDKYGAIIYQDILSWGTTPQAAAGLCGNIMAEGQYGSDTLQSWIAWSDFRRSDYNTSGTGLGLVQFTFWSIQNGLFKYSDLRGKDWTDLSTQLDYMLYLFRDSPSKLDWDTFIACTDVNEAADTILRWENPNVFNYDDRRKYANEAYDKFNGLEPSAYGTRRPEGMDLVNASGNNSNTNNSTTTILDENNLTGMPEASQLKDKQENIDLPDSNSLSMEENYYTSVIRGNRELEKSVSLLDLVRRITAFIGLVLISYALVFIICIYIDKVNVWVDVSFLRIVTFGCIRLQTDMEKRTPRGYISIKKAKFVGIIIVVFGFIILSGAASRGISNVMYEISQKFM